MPCYVNQVVQAADLLKVSPETKDKMLRQTFKSLSGFRSGEHAFYTFDLVQDVIRSFGKGRDPYRGLKKKFNRLCLNLEPEVRKTIEDSTDPFQTALRIAVAGNIIDFVKGSDMDEKDIRKTIEEALNQEMDQEKIELLRRKIDDARHIVYVGDNAGEIVFDKIFIQQFDGKKVVFCVRGAPVVNDATMEDAEQAGLTDNLKVITTGSDLPGAMVVLSGEEFKEEFNKADLVISKGQGNYEALSGEDKEIFFLLKVKCPVISECFEGRYMLGDIVIDDLR